MKKFLFACFAVCNLLIFISCVTTEFGDYSSDSVSVENCAVSGNNIADVELLAGSDEGVLDSYFLTVRNISERDIFIDWSKSRITADGMSVYPFEKGVKYDMAINGFANNTLVSKGSSYANTIFSSAQVYFNESTAMWRVGAFDDPETVVKICITDGINDTYYTFNTYQQASENQF